MSFIKRPIVVSSLPYMAWFVSVASVVTLLLVWGENVRWQLGGLSAYSWFPLFGLTAFSLMWAHYMVTVARQAMGEGAPRLERYYRITSWVVLVALLMHPGLLVWQLWADGFGLPPSSYLTHYVPADLGWVAMLGFLALMAFLAFELWRWFNKKPWWRWVGWASEFAMIAVFHHALRLGGELQVEWFRMVWLLYGLSLVVAFAYLHWSSYRRKEDPEPWRTRGRTVGVIVVVIGVVALVTALLA